MGLELYEKYWSFTSSDRDKERKRLRLKGGGNAIAAQHPMIQNNLFNYLKRLYKQAGIRDWVAEVDHTLTYYEQKRIIMERYGVEGFKADIERRNKKYEAMAEDHKQGNKTKRGLYEQKTAHSSSGYDVEIVQIEEIGGYSGPSESRESSESSDDWIENEVSDPNLSSGRE